MVFNSIVSRFNVPVNAINIKESESMLFFFGLNMSQEYTADGSDRSHQSGNIFELDSSYA